VSGKKKVSGTFFSLFKLNKGSWHLCFTRLDFVATIDGSPVGFECDGEEWCPSGKGANVDPPMPGLGAGQESVGGLGARPEWMLSCEGLGARRWLSAVIVPRPPGVGFATTEVAPGR
jgi:hypothetical protein